MPNPYSVNMPNGFEDANQQAILNAQQSVNPSFQNTGAQQAYMNQQLGQGSQMSQPTSHGTSVAGLNPLAMAMMLRNGGSGVTAPTSDISQVGGINPSQTAINPVGSLAYSPTTYGGSSYGLGGIKY